MRLAKPDPLHSAHATEETLMVRKEFSECFVNLHS